MLFSRTRPLLGLCVSQHTHCFKWVESTKQTCNCTYSQGQRCHWLTGLTFKTHLISLEMIYVVAGKLFTLPKYKSLETSPVQNTDSVIIWNTTSDVSVSEILMGCGLSSLFTVLILQIWVQRLPCWPVPGTSRGWSGSCSSPKRLVWLTGPLTGWILDPMASMSTPWETWHRTASGGINFHGLQREEPC